MTSPHLTQLAFILAGAFQLGGMEGYALVDGQGSTIEVEDTEGRRYTVTVASSYVDTDGATITEIWQRCPDRDVYANAHHHERECDRHDDDVPENSDDDGDDDEEPADGESFDGGFGPGSYFSHAMNKDD